MTYTNETCQICGKAFADGDDIVTCPECGTPVHRACWAELGHCPNEEKHGAFDWTPSQSEEPKQTYQQYDSQGNVYEQPDEDIDPRDRDMEDWLKLQEDSFNHNTEQNTEKRYLGVSEAELTHFLCPYPGKGAYYVMLFKNMATTGRKFSLNVFALFLSPIYQFYRKMYGFGTVLSLLLFILYIPQLILVGGVYFSNALANSPILTSESFMMFENIFYYISVGISIFLCIFSDFIYLRWTVRKIKSIREMYAEKDTSEEYYQALAKAGNPGFRFALIGFGILFALSWICLVVMELTILK